MMDRNLILLIGGAMMIVLFIFGLYIGTRITQAKCQSLPTHSYHRTEVHR